MRESIKKLWKGMLLVALMVVCVPKVAEAAEIEDVTTTGLSIDIETEESTYKAGSGTISWIPTVVDGEGNVTSPAKLILNNATIEAEEGIYIWYGRDITVEVIGANQITCEDGFALEFEGGDEPISVTVTGGGTLDMETDNPYNEQFGMSVVGGLYVTGGVTISIPKAGIWIYDLIMDEAQLTCDKLVATQKLHVKSGTLNVKDAEISGWGQGATIEKEATVNAEYLILYEDLWNKGEVNADFIGLHEDMKNEGILNAVVSTADAAFTMTVYGDVVLDDEDVSKQLIEFGNKVVISEGATLTVPEGTGLDMSEKELIFATDSSLVIEGEVLLPADTTAEDIAKMNLTGAGVVVVAGASDTEEKVYTTEGNELNAVSGLDFTNVGMGEGQTAPTGDGYTWDATSETLNLSNAYIDGSLNLPAGSKIVVSGVNIVRGDVTVAGTVSDAFTLSGEGSIASSGGKKYVSHSYKDPTFTWTKTKDGYTAKATFVCQGGEDVKTVDAKVTATTTNATYTAEGKVLYEAKVTFNGKDYTDSKEVVIPKNELMGVQIEDAKSKAIYKVTSVTATGGTVEYVKNKSKTVKIVSIPKTITMDGLTFKVTSIGAKAFKGYKNLTKVTIGNNVKTIGKEAFSGCKKLKTVKMGSNVTTLGDKAFYNCVKITSITIPSKVSKIGKSTFEKCKKLKTVTIKSKKLTAKKVGAKAFKGIKSTAIVKVPKKKYKTYKSMLQKKGVSKKARFKKI